MLKNNFAGDLSTKHLLLRQLSVTVMSPVQVINPFSSEVCAT